MIIAQVILILPIIISVGTETLESISKEYEELFLSLNVNLRNKIKVILWDGRFLLFTCILTGLGRALSEVGAIIIVGGNILHVTRVMTTTIALETSKGNLTLAMSLGIILIFISIILNSLALITKHLAKSFHMTSDLKITLKNINFTIEGNQFFKNLNLKFSSSGISVILGPNGSGKTLLLNLIMGLIKPKCGEINFAGKGRNITKSFVSQKITMLRRSVRDNICFPLKIEGKKKKFYRR